MHICNSKFVSHIDRSFLRLAEEEYTTLPNDVSLDTFCWKMIQFISLKTFAAYSQLNL